MMSSVANRYPLHLRALIYGFILLWVLMAAFPFFWTLWGSFKVELDFFSIANWTNAITGQNTFTGSIPSQLGELTGLNLLYLGKCLILQGSNGAVEAFYSCFVD